MGASYSAMMVVGVPFDRKFLWQPPKKVRAFDHNYPESMNFDPDSGRALWEEEEESIPGYDDAAETLGGCHIVTGGDYGGCWIGAITLSQGEYDKPGFCRLTAADLEQAREKLRTVLEPLRAWDESKFGIYTILGVWA